MTHVTSSSAIKNVVKLWIEEEDIISSNGGISVIFGPDSETLSANRADFHGSEENGRTSEEEVDLHRFQDHAVFSSIIFESKGVLAGVPFADALLRQLDCEATWTMGEGTYVGTVPQRVATVTGSVCNMARAKRLLSTVLSKASGLATYANRLIEMAALCDWPGAVCADADAPGGCTPGQQLLERHSLLVGGVRPAPASGSVVSVPQARLASAELAASAMAAARRCAAPFGRVGAVCGGEGAALRACRLGADLVTLECCSVEDCTAAARAVKAAHPGVVVQARPSQPDLSAYFAAPEIDALCVDVAARGALRPDSWPTVVLKAELTEAVVPPADLPDGTGSAAMRKRRFASRDASPSRPPTAPVGDQATSAGAKQRRVDTQQPDQLTCVPAAAAGALADVLSISSGGCDSNRTTPVQPATATCRELVPVARVTEAAVPVTTAARPVPSSAYAAAAAAASAARAAAAVAQANAASAASASRHSGTTVVRLPFGFFRVPVSGVSAAAAASGIPYRLLASARVPSATAAAAAFAARPLSAAAAANAFRFGGAGYGGSAAAAQFLMGPWVCKICRRANMYTTVCRYCSRGRVM